MIYGIGTDLLDAGRVRRLHARYGGRLVQRLLHEAERDAFAQAKDPAHFLARSFAVKEAVAKALGTGFRGIAHHDIGCIRNDLGKPELVFTGHARGILDRMNVVHAHVSLSDEAEMIMAFVVLETAAR